MAELALHSNVQSISEDDLQSLKGCYYYVSHRLLKSIRILKEITREYNEDGSTKKQHKQKTEYTIATEHINDLLNLLIDLEVRLRRMFIDPVPIEKVVSSDGYIQGPLRRRGRATKKKIIDIS